MQILYSLLLYLLTPLVLLRLLYRSLKNPDYRKRIPERFGFYHGRPEPGGFWVHAVSVGEAITAVKLIRALQAEYPGRAMTVTCGTPTGSGIIQQQLGDSVFHAYAPYDLPGAVKRFIRRIEPATGIIMETEIWPNLFKQASQSGARLLIANMRLSDRSFERYRKISGLTRRSLARVDQFAAQTESDAQRAIALGADPDRVAVVGNLKFDIEQSALPAAHEIAQFRKRVAGGRMAWLAGSTHQGEDEVILDVHEKLLVDNPDLLLILVPRHPERFAGVYQLSAQRFHTQKRSEIAQGESLPTSAQVLLVDTIGELARFIAISDWAFIGGSMVPVGGHNILEACQAGVPVLFGEHMSNFRQVAELALAQNAGTQVRDQAQLLNACQQLAANPALRKQQGNNGLTLIQSNRGALDETLALV